MSVRLVVGQALAFLQLPCGGALRPVSMGEQPRSDRTGRLPLSLTMHHAILPFLDYRLAQWNSRCSRPVVLPSKFAVLTGRRVLAASCVAGNSGNGNLDKKRARVVVWVVLRLR